MSLRTFSFAFAPLFGLALAACEGADTLEDPEALRRYCGDDFAEVERRVAGIVGGLTLEEKVGLMHGSALAADDGAYRTFSDPARGIPGLRMVDGPRGVSAGTGNATAFPVGMARGATWDPALERRVGEAMGREARAAGASVLLAPTVNVLRHPRWGRAQETYGEDPTHIGAMAVAFIEGAQEHVLASVKHFAVNSIEETRFSVSANLDERTLREIYLPHFRRAVVDANVASVMSAYNRVNGLYCSENPHLLRDILKGEWAFQGFVESDWVFGTNSTVGAALGGLDIEMPQAVHFDSDLVAAVEAGEVPESVIDEAATRVLRAQLCFGLDVDPPVADDAQLETSETVALAREVAERSIVLLKNEGGLLPIDRTQVTDVVVMGPLAELENIGDTGSSAVSPSTVVTALEGITAAAGAVTVTHVTGDPNEAGNAATIGAADVVVVVVGLTADDEGEGLIGASDRASLTLAPEQVALLDDVAALSGSVVVVLEGGSAITMESFLSDVEAVLMAWYPGMEGGHAIARVLFGDVNPSGRLPIVFAADEADLPLFDGVSLEVTYGYFHGQRHLDREGIAPLFPFGFGLSYTTFAYANLALESATVAPDGVLRATVEVTNTGAVAGVETVQLYVHAASSRVERAARELEAFAQVALAPSETATVALEVRAEDLAFWDVDADAFEVEATDYVVEVGSHALDLSQSATFAIP